MNILTMLYSAMFLCLAMPELPPETIAELQLVQGQAQNLTLQSEGMNIYTETTSSNSANIGATLMTFANLYRGLQAWNEWNGGDDYIIKRQYVMERTDLPAWLAEYSGDVIFWELEYFGHTVEMITDKDGKILVNPQKGKAVNVRIKDTMVESARKYKAENPGFKNIPSVEYAPKGYPSVLDAVPDPYLQGGYLIIPVLDNGTLKYWSVPNTGNTSDKFENMYIWANVYQSGGNNTILLFGNNDVRNFPQSITAPGSNSVYTGYYTNSGQKCCGVQFSDGHQLTFKLPCQYGTRSGYAGQTSYMYVSNYRNSVNCIGFVNSQPVIQTTEPLYVKQINASRVENFPAWGLDLTEMSISADSLDSIQFTISEIQPQTDSETGIDILTYPENIPLPEEVPMTPEESPIPDGPVYPEFDFPIGDPEQVPESDPETAPTTAPTEISLPENAEEIPVPETLSVVNGLQNRFPFSIPWDIYNALSNLSAEREIPHWEWTMNVNMPFSEEVFSYTFVLDLGFMAGTVGLFRNLFLLAFILGLAVYSYNKFFGGGA